MLSSLGMGCLPDPHLFHNWVELYRHKCKICVSYVPLLSPSLWVLVFLVRQLKICEVLVKCCCLIPLKIRKQWVGRGRDLNSGERLHRPLCCQATPPRPLFHAKLAPRPLLPSFMLGFDTDIANTLFSFAEDFPAIVVLSSNIFKTYLDQLAGLFSIEGDVCYELVVWQTLE